MMATRGQSDVAVEAKRRERGMKVFNIFQDGVLVLQYYYTQLSGLRKQPNPNHVHFLNFHIYFVSEQGNRFGAKAISLGYLGYLIDFEKIFTSKNHILNFC